MAEEYRWDPLGEVGDQAEVQGIFRVPQAAAGVVQGFGMGGAGTQAAIGAVFDDPEGDLRRITGVCRRSLAFGGNDPGLPSG